MKVTLRPMPPAPVLWVIAMLVLLMPFGSWTLAGVREWQMGGTLADTLTGPYFRGIVWLRLVGAFFLAALLWSHRRPESIWIAVTSVWLAGPPLQMMLIGMEGLAASGGRISVPPQGFPILVWWNI